MKILGIDLGIKRIGLAMGNELELGVRLLAPLRVRNQAQLIDAVDKLALSEEVSRVIIGIPCALTPASKAIASRATALKKALEERFIRMPWPMEIVLIDEALSSKEGLKRLIASGVSRTQRREKIDSAAAAMIIEDYWAMLKDKTC